jgi:tetratricopeptide (TPR) repeat protein
MVLGRTDNNQNWIAYAAACFLNHDFENCLKVIDDFKKLVTTDDPKKALKPFEMSEVLILEAHALEKSGQHYKAVNLILKKDKKITNQISKFEALARNYEKLGKPEKAIENLNALLQIGSANANYYWKVLELKGIPKPKDANDILSESE